MYSKVIYIVKSDLHYYPPCVSQIRLLKKNGVEVEVWYGSSDKSAIDVLDIEDIPHFCLGERERTAGTLGKLRNWLDFRKRVNTQLANLMKHNEKDVLLWFGTTESAIPLAGIIEKYNYVLTSLELLDDKENTTKRKLFGKLAQKAQAVVACEETRAYIMQYWYGLPKLPYVMPNKPYSLGVCRKAVPTCERTKEVIKQITDKKFIIYQGIFQNVDYMSELAKALKLMDSDYYLVMMGFDTHNQNIINILKSIYDKVIHIQSIPAPLHLEVTSHAYIGLVFYDGVTLNKAFCAPNKIYEYSGFGIPAISNNIPGLKNTIGNAGAGVCVDFKAENLIKAIIEIDNNYEKYSENALQFYAKTDNFETMKNIVTDLDVRVKDK